MERAETACVTQYLKRGPATWSDATRWAVASMLLAFLLLVVIWLVVSDAPIVRVVVRLYQDKHYLKETVASWGWMAPFVFVVIQALQVVVSPIPGEITGPDGDPDIPGGGPA